MNAEQRIKGRSDLPAFRGEAQARPDEEGDGAPTALAIAIAEAAQQAAAHLDERELAPMDFEVSRIQITVAPNPGPTSYKVTITPSG